MPLDVFRTIPTDVLLIVPYGSVVYGTTTPTSDRDYIGVSESFYNFSEFKTDQGDITWYSRQAFQQKLDEQEISVIEAFFTTPVFGDVSGFTYTVDKEKLRESVSKKCSNSWVKAKKKITLPNEDTYIGIKSLYHSFRMFEFGIELAKTGKISKFGAGNYIWKELLDCKDKWEDWDFLYEKFKTRHNAKSSEFKLVCPKKIT